MAQLEVLLPWMLVWCNKRSIINSLAMSIAQQADQGLGLARLDSLFSTGYWKVGTESYLPEILLL
jgi:hypothetical protein